MGSSKCKGDSCVPNSSAVIVTKESGIKTLKDLKGKRVSWILGNPSLNVKMEAYLAFANLTWDDTREKGRISQLWSHWERPERMEIE
jgi:TRAP-type uncharacterized transport system substrate-binding protein